MNDNTDIFDVGLICKVGLYSRQHLLLPRACSILRLRPSTSLRQCFAHRALAEGVSNFSEDRKSATSLIGSRNHRFGTILIQKNTIPQVFVVGVPKLCILKKC